MKTIRVIFEFGDEPADHIAVIKGEVVKFNYVRWMQLTPNEQAFVLFHETMHAMWRPEHLTAMDAVEEVLRDDET